MRRKILYLDANLPPAFARGLVEFLDVDEDGIEVKYIPHEFGIYSPDEEWIPGIAGNYLLTRDLNIYRTRNQNRLISINNIGAFFLQDRNMKFKHMAFLILKHLQKIVDVIKENEGPFAYEILERSMKKRSGPS